MRTFLRDVTWFVGMQFALLMLLYARYQISEDYLAAANDKLDLLVHTPPPRVLLIGGSSVAWSSISPLIETAVGLPTVNCAYHAGLGLSFREQEIKQCAQPGDVVVVSIEWGVFPDRPRPRVVTELFLAAPRTIRFMNWRDRKLILDGTLPAIRMPLKALAEDFKQHGIAAFSRESARKAKTIRLRRNFNAHGDFTGHYGQRPFGFEGRDMEVPSVDELRQGIDGLNQVHDWCRSHDVRLVYVLPFIPESMRRNNQRLDACLHELTGRLTIPILNPTDFVMPDEGYFDSVYHLREPWGRRRTERIANALADYLERVDLP